MQRLEEMLSFLRNRKTKIVTDSKEEELSDLNKLSEYIDNATIFGSSITDSKSTPSISIEFTDHNLVELAQDTVNLVLEILQEYSVTHSVYVVWTGKWFEVRIHEEAIPPSFIEKYGSRSGFLITEFILRKYRNKFVKIANIAKGRIVIKNHCAISGWLIAPLSLVFSKSLYAVYLKPRSFKEFDPSFCTPTNLKHDTEWKSFVENECETLIRDVEKFLERTTIGHQDYTEIRSVAQSIPSIVGRFEVMALLQAARYYVLTGDLEKAKSFGLNRAIFYAWAKYYGSRRIIRGYTRPSTGTPTSTSSSSQAQPPLKDYVELSPRGWFMIGDQEQTPQDFDSQVKTKFEAVVPFEIVWNKAVRYVKRFPPEVLRDPNKFFKYVYEPVRDRFLELLSMPTTTMSVEPRTKTQHRHDGRRVEEARKPFKSLTDFLSSRKE